MSNPKPSSLDLPGFVRVGPVRYTISLVKEVRRHTDGLDLMGDINAEGHPCEMRLWKDSAPSRLFVTFWHELVHAIGNQIGAGDLEERIVDGLAFNLAQVLIDNPWIGKIAEELADTMRRIEP